MTLACSFRAYLLAVLLLVAPPASAASAGTCAIPTTVPGKALAKAAGPATMFTTRSKDPDSNEPVARTIIDYTSGSMIVVEQSNCIMENIRITILSPKPVPTDADLARAGAILGVMPIWTRNYPGRKAGDVFRNEVRSSQFQKARPAGRFFYAVDQRLDASAAATEAIVSFISTDSPAVQYKSQFSVYLGIGGQ